MKLTQTAFGKMLGVSLRTVQSWESGDRNIPNSTLKLLNSQLKSAETTYLNEPKDTSDSGLYGYGDSIRLDLDSLLKSKEDLHKLVFFFNDNIDALSKNEVVGIFLERLRSDYRAEYKLELAALLNKNTKLNEDEIKAILTSKPQKTN